MVGHSGTSQYKIEGAGHGHGHEYAGYVEM